MSPAARGAKGQDARRGCKKAQPPKGDLCGAYFFYEVCLTLLEVCSEQRKPNNYGLIRPAGAAKKADPITAPKGIANREVGSFGLAELSFALATETIAKNKKHDQRENG